MFNLRKFSHIGSLDKSMREKSKIILFAQLSLLVQIQPRPLLSQNKEAMAKMQRDTEELNLRFELQKTQVLTI